MEDEDSEQHCADCTDASLHRICHSYWDSLCCFGQEYGTQHVQQSESSDPSPILRSNCQFGLPEAESEACFTKVSDDGELSSSFILFYLTFHKSYLPFY